MMLRTSAEAQSSGLTWEGANSALSARGEGDRMVVSFVSSAMGTDVTSPRAEQLVLAAADSLDVPAYQLDHTIWHKQLGRPVKQLSTTKPFRCRAEAR